MVGSGGGLKAYSPINSSIFHRGQAVGSSPATGGPCTSKSISINIHAGRFGASRRLERSHTSDCGLSRVHLAMVEKEDAVVVTLQRDLASRKQSREHELEEGSLS